MLLETSPNSPPLSRRREHHVSPENVATFFLEDLSLSIYLSEIYKLFAIIRDAPAFVDK